MKFGKRSNSQTQVCDDSLGQEIKETAEPQMPIFEINITKSIEEGDSSPADTDKQGMKFNKKSSYERGGSAKSKEKERQIQADLQRKNDVSRKTPSSIDEVLSNQHFAESKYSKEYVK